jgi:hypothetical protein
MRAAASERRGKMGLRDLPPELIVWEIMVRLPFKSLLRFRCVCKAWRDRISNDAEFHGAHRRAQTPSLLAWGGSTDKDRRNMVTTISIYVSESGESGALEDTMKLPLEVQPHSFAHCDGLVLMPTKTDVRALNPANTAGHHAALELQRRGTSVPLLCIPDHPPAVWHRPRPSQ